MSTISPVITQAGLAAAIAAHGQGLDLKITHVALGSGAYNPTGNETGLVSRREKATCAPGSSGSGNEIVVIAAFTAYSGAEYDLGEIGWYAGDPDAGGVLFAVASEAGSRFSVRIPGGGSYTTVYTLVLSGVPDGSVTVVVDPDAGFASDLMAAHLAASNPHPQYELPVGAEMEFMRKTAPRGWLNPCGALVSRTTFAELWAVAQAHGLVAPSETVWKDSAWTLFGPGNGTTTFRLPDERAEFIRVWDNHRGVDPGRANGSAQGDALGSHEHISGIRLQYDSASVYGTTGVPRGGKVDVTDGSAETAARSGVTGDVETRPRNAARLRCIKAGPSTLPAGPEPAIASFTAAPGSSAAQVVFTDTSVGANNWTWDFGDGTTSTTRNPTKTYTQPGTYTVTLTVRTTADVVSRAIAKDLVVVAPSGSGTSSGGSGGGSSGGGSVGGPGNVSTEMP